MHVVGLVQRREAGRGKRGGDFKKHKTRLDDSVTKYVSVWSGVPASEAERDGVLGGECKHGKKPLMNV